MSRWFLFAVSVVMMSACKPRTDAGSGASADPAAPPTVTAAPVKPVLPPEPLPMLAEKAGEVPALEAALAKDAAYQAVWTGPRSDLNAFLSYVSQVLSTGGSAPAPLGTALKAKKLHDAGIKLFLVFARVGTFPDEFATKFASHLDATKGEPHLGVWSAHSKGAPLHDYSCLAAWSRPEEAAYLREHLAAKKDGAGPFGWSAWSGKDAPARPWLVDEGAALERLAILGSLTPDEVARAAFLKAEAKKPRQPKLGEEFKLGDFTYAVKDVEVVDSVGSGFGKKKASEGAQFVLVHFAMRNDASATETVLTDDFRIVDAQGREYRPSSEANTALVMSGGKDLGLTELQPGLKKSMTTAFEMPEAAAKGVFTLVIPEKGLLGMGSVRITLK